MVLGEKQKRGRGEGKAIEERLLRPGKQDKVEVIKVRESRPSGGYEGKVNVVCNHALMYCVNSDSLLGKWLIVAGVIQILCEGDNCSDITLQSRLIDY